MTWIDYLCTVSERYPALVGYLCAIVLASGTIEVVSVVR